MTPQLAREQRWTIFALSVIAFVLAMMWVRDEVCGVLTLGFNLEPLVVSLASAVPIVTLYWPFRPKFRSKRIADKIIVDGTYRNVAEMGAGDYKFIVSITPASNTCAHIYISDPIMSGAFVSDANYFEDVKDASAFTLSTKNQTPNRGDVIVLKNRFNNYCLMVFEEIEAKNFDGGNRDMWTIRYVINPKGGVNFS